MHFLLGLAWVLAQSGEALRAADQLFGPLGIILGAFVLLIVAGMGTAIRVLWSKNQKLRERNEELTHELHEQSDEMADKVIRTAQVTVSDGDDGDA